jgi:hypothetical protein
MMLQAKRLFTKASPVEDMKEEMVRRRNNRDRLLTAFESKGELTTREIMRFGTGVSSRIFELRKSGYVIKVRYEKPGHYTYIYMGRRDEA